MATENEHLARAKYNENFAAMLSTITQAEWKIIASFYAALHYVEAVIVRNKGASTDHNSRSQYIRRIAELRKISAEYATLGNYAWEARYDPTTNFGQSKNVQDVCDLLPFIRKELGF